MKKLLLLFSVFLVFSCNQQVSLDPNQSAESKLTAFTKDVNFEQSAVEFFEFQKEVALGLKQLNSSQKLAFDSEFEKVYSITDITKICKDLNFDNFEQIQKAHNSIVLSNLKLSKYGFETFTQEESKIVSNATIKILTNYQKSLRGPFCYQCWEGQTWLWNNYSFCMLLMTSPAGAASAWLICGSEFRSKFRGNLNCFANYC